MSKIVYETRFFFSHTSPSPEHFLFLWDTNEKKGKRKYFFLLVPQSKFFFPFGVEEAWCNLVLKIILDMRKKYSFLVLGNVKVASAKFFNFGFYCKPILFFICHYKIQKDGVEVEAKSVGRWALTICQWLVVFLEKSGKIMAKKRIIHSLHLGNKRRFH